MEAALPNEPNRPLHRRDGRRHQGAQAHQRAAQPPGLVCNPLAGDVFPQIDHLEAIVIEHNPDDIFTDIVDIPLYRGEQDRAMLFRRGATRQQMLLNRLKRIGRRSGAAHELRQEDRLLLKALPDLVEGWYKDMIDDIVGIPRLQ